MTNQKKQSTWKSDAFSEVPSLCLKTSGDL